MKVVIYKGKLDEVINQLKKDIENEKDMVSNNEH